MAKSIKQQMRELLKRRDYNRIVELCENDRHFWNELRFRLYEIDETIRWSAIKSVAKFMKLIWDKGRHDDVRVYIRTLFWSLNDESGGIGWSSPQTIAEIIVQIPELIDPYGSMVIAHTIDEPPLVKSGLWAIGRLGRMIEESVRFFQDKVLSVFDIDDPEVLCLAVWAFGEVNFKPAMPFIGRLLDREEIVRIFVCDDFQEKTLGLWAKEAIDKINNRLN